MADKNPDDIKNIAELTSPKKTPIRNTLTLLALLLIILVISVVITKLIINTDEGQEIEQNNPTLTAEVNDSNESAVVQENSVLSSATTATAAAVTAAATTAAVSNVLERNLTSRTKVPLRTHTPVKDVKKEITASTSSKEPKTYKEPKHASTAPVKNSASVKHTTSHTERPKNVDRVITHSTATRSSSSSRASYLGGHLKKITNSYYIKVGSYRDTSTIVHKIKKSNFNYSITKVKGDRTISRVLIGPFYSKHAAQKNIAKVKARILPGAYITKVKP